MVDADKSHADLIRRALRSAGKKFNITLAGTLAEAQSILKKTSPDLMISDYLLPDGKGIELLPGNSSKLTYPVVILTSHGNELIAAAAMKAGAIDYIAKSNEAFAEMPHIIDRTLREWQQMTKYKQAEEALQQQHKRARKIIETARDAFVGMDVDGIITDWNPQAEKIFGWSRKEALGRLMSKTIIPETYREAHTNGLKHYLATGEGLLLNKHVEVTAQHRNGHTLPIELSIVSMRLDGTLTFNAFIRDISARQKAQKALKASLIDTVVAIFKAVEAHDPYTAGHQQRVAQLARCIAREMGLDADRIDGLMMGATIHDIGKIPLPAEMFSKPTELTEKEKKLVQTHCQVGYDILKDVKFPWPVADIAFQHHERLDGTGYPQGLKGEEICLEARIVAVADVVEAMSSHRSYRSSLGVDVALEEIVAHRGEWYEPAAVDACLQLIREKEFSFDGKPQ